MERAGRAAPERRAPRPGHGVHAGGPLPAPAVPRADRGREQIEVLDPLAGEIDPGPLAEALADPAIEIVLHAGRQDVAILSSEWQTTFMNVFDTQVAAGFAGFSAQAGYSGLLYDVLRIRLSKIVTSAVFTPYQLAASR